LEKNENHVNNLPCAGDQSHRENSLLLDSKIEKLLFKAVIDENFRNVLFSDRKAALESPEFSLTPQDKIILESIPVTTLVSTMAGMIKRLTLANISTGVLEKHGSRNRVCYRCMSWGMLVVQASVPAYCWN